MTTYLTTYPEPSLGRWLAALAGSLVLWALAYALAPDPAEQLGLHMPDAYPLAKGHPAPRSSFVR